MAEATLTTSSLEGKSPGELEQRRREIVTYLRDMPGGYDDPSVPIEILHELTVITSTLRRRTAGPPRAKPSKGVPKQKATVGDLLF